MTTPKAGLDLLLRHGDLRELLAEPALTPVTDLLDEGAVVFRIDAFGLTANNVTYAALGDAFSYFKFFPARDGYVRVPVWGFGDVVASRASGVSVGERYYGFFPMSRYLVTSAARVNDLGFMDGVAHRAPLPAIYNHYARTSTDPAYRSDAEDLQMLLRPVFTTAFLIDDFLAKSDFFGADEVIFSSASSKTAYGAAFLLHARTTRPKIIGLTSNANIAFTRSLGVYDEVLTYDAAATLSRTSKSVYVDMAGNSHVRAAVHRHKGDALVYSCAVGGTHWEQRDATGPLPGARPTLFFAPTYGKERVAEWGARVFAERLGSAWSSFLAKVRGAPDATAASAEPLLNVVHGRGAGDVARVYLDLVEGRARPLDGHVLTMWGDAE